MYLGYWNLETREKPRNRSVKNTDGNFVDVKSFVTEEVEHAGLHWLKDLGIHVLVTSPMAYYGTQWGHTQKKFF